ncbi:MAG: hypothetical protein K2X72_31575 [Reyranella sp.]|nr:hypothetical protein [Reyranella sp.]
MTDEAADHAMMEIYRREIIGVQAIGHVHEQWQRPAHDQVIDQVCGIAA